jgi:hypothetical protein
LRPRHALLALSAAAALSAVGTGASDGSPSRFRVLLGGKWGYIDSAGKLVIPARFERAADFSGGLAAVLEGSTFGYVDPSGKLVLVPGQQPAGYLHRPFADGRAVVRAGNRHGAIDRAGKLAVAARFVSIDDFSDGHALACDGDGCGWIDVDGKGVLGPAGMGGTPMRGGVATGWLSMGMGRKRAFLHRLGRGRLPDEYQDTGGFSEGLVAVRPRDRWGYVDGDGTPVIPLRYRWAGDFSEGLAPAREDRVLCGYIDRTGAFAIPARFRECRPFSNGLARVDLAGEFDAPRVGFIDRAGKPVFEGADADPPFDSALDFAGGLAAVGQGGPVFTAAPEAASGPLLGYVERSGKYVWKPTR